MPSVCAAFIGKRSTNGASVVAANLIFAYITVTLVL